MHQLALEQRVVEAAEVRAGKLRGTASPLHKKVNDGLRGFAWTQGKEWRGREGKRVMASTGISETQRWILRLRRAIPTASGHKNERCIRGNGGGIEGFKKEGSGGIDGLNAGIEEGY